MITLMSREREREREREFSTINSIYNTCAITDVTHNAAIKTDTSDKLNPTIYYKPNTYKTLRTCDNTCLR